MLVLAAAVRVAQEAGAPAMLLHVAREAGLDLGRAAQVVEALYEHEYVALVRDRVRYDVGVVVTSRGMELLEARSSS